MRLGLMILTDTPWREGARRWLAAEKMGFDSVWTYDHLHWRTLRDSSWYTSLPMLAGAAAVTERITLGLMVASPNFRHPVTLSKDTVTIDDISGGRFVLGIGRGAPDAGDSAVMGAPALTPEERTSRFEEFVGLADRLLRSPITSHTGRFYSVKDAVMIPGCVQSPRAPLAIAASGPRGLGGVLRRPQGRRSLGNQHHPHQQRHLVPRLKSPCRPGRRPRTVRLIGPRFTERWSRSPADG